MTKETLLSEEQLSELTKDSKLKIKFEQVWERWENFEHRVWQDGFWKLEGFITYFQHLHEFSRVLDPSLPASMPSHCFDPHEIANFFGFPVEEFGIEFFQQNNSLNDSELPLQQVADALTRLADQFAPEPEAVVGTTYVASKLGCTTEWIGQLIRSGEIPKNCIVQGTGNGKLWKLDRRKIDQWLKNR